MTIKNSLPPLRIKKTFSIAIIGAKALFIGDRSIARATVERSTLLYIREGGSAVRDLALSSRST
jgi:hypothetical protein